MFYKASPVVLAVVVLAGCASVPPADYAPVEQTLRERGQLPAQATLRPAATEATAAALHQHLQQPLTPASAKQIALLKNPALHAELAELGVSQAELVEAGLLSNPTFAVGALRPEGGGRWQLDLGLSQSLMDLMTRSLRRSLAQADYERVQMELAERLTRALQSVEATYYAAVAARHRAALLAQIAEAAAVNRELANRFYSAGNISELQYLQEAAEANARRLEAEQAQAAARVARFNLATALGMRPGDGFELPEQLPDLPPEQFQLQALVDQALTRRLDLQILQQSTQRYQHQLALYRRSGGFEELELGINAEREFDGAENIGPELAFTLPIFHQGQARIAQAEARLEQITDQQEASRIAIENEVAAALTELNASRSQLQNLKMLVIPQRERIVQLQLQRYNFMLAGVAEALVAKQQEYEGYLAYVDALRDYWQARSTLAMAVGGGLPEPALSPAPAPQTQRQPEMQHHGHHQGEAAQTDSHGHQGHGQLSAPPSDHGAHGGHAPAQPSKQNSHSDHSSHGGQP